MSKEGGKEGVSEEGRREQKREEGENYSIILHSYCA